MTSQGAPMIGFGNHFATEALGGDRELAAKFA